MPTFTTKFRATVALSTSQVLAGSRDTAIAALVTAAIGGVAGREAHVLSCDLTGITGTTGIYSGVSNYTNPLTGSTFNATDRNDAIRQQAAAGPTGPGSNMEIWDAA